VCGGVVVWLLLGPRVSCALHECVKAGWRRTALTSTGRYRLHRCYRDLVPSQIAFTARTACEQGNISRMPIHRTAAVAVTALATALIAGCFQPNPRQGIACGAGGECPPGQSCGSDLRCHLPGDGLFDAPPVGCQSNADCQTGQGTECGPFGQCGGFDGICDSSGTMSRTCTQFTCQAGACTGTPHVDTQPCSIATDGVSCGIGVVVTDCGPCSGSSALGCALDGQQTCMCTDMRCMNDTCQTTSSRCTQSGCATLGPGEVCRTISNGCPGGQPQDFCCADRTCSDECGPCGLPE
jgi:hypothetical protein